MAEKNPAAVVEQRVSEVHRLLLAGVRRRDVLQFASKQKWGVSDRTVDDYISKANDAIREAADVDRALEVGRAVQRLQDLYRAAVQDKDHRTALQVQKELTALLGLAEAANLNLNVDFGDMQPAMDAWKESIARNYGKPSEPADDA